MSKKRLEAYRSERQEIEELKHKLRNLKADDYIGNSVIMNYSKGYPSPQAVVGVDLDAYQTRRSRLMEEIARLERRCMEVEQWIDTIPDSATRRIFRLYYEDGHGQQTIAKTMHMDQSVVSRRINNYIKCDERK